MTKRDDSPNKDIDKAIERLLKEVTGKDAESIVPEVVTAKVRVLQLAVSWEKTKHHIKDDDDFDPTTL